jgi:flagellar basal body-associated protein FliL
VEVNLKDAHAGRVLEMHVQIEVNQRDASAAERATAALRDAVIVAVSDYTYEDLEGVDGKARLKDELTARFGVLLSNVRIERLYLTQFVVR